MFLHPKRLAISGGYFGFYKTIDIYKRIRGDLEIIGIDEPYQPGDVCWLETPLNPTGEARDIQYYADKVIYFTTLLRTFTQDRLVLGSCSRREVSRRLDLCSSALAGPLQVGRRFSHALGNEIHGWSF